MWFLNRLPILAALLGFFAAFVWLDRDKSTQAKLYPPYSLHNTSERGASLAFRYIKESRNPSSPPVNELNRRIEFADLPAGAVVFRLAPEIKPGERPDDEDDPHKSGKKGNLGDPDEPEEKEKPEKPAKLKKPGEKPHVVIPLAERPLFTQGEANWIKAGGRLVLALNANYGPIEAITTIHNDPFEKTFPLWPGIETLIPTSARTLKSAAFSDAHTIFTLHGQPFAVRLPLGNGDLIVLAAPEIFTNSNLAKADNLKFLAQLAPPARAIYFDEFVHGLQTAPGAGELLVKWGMGMGLLVMAVGAFFLFWRVRTPIGPPEDDHKETRTQAIDFVGSLAPLYNRALEPHQALALHYNNFLHTVTAQTGLRGTDLAAKMQLLLATKDLSAYAGQRPLQRGEFDRLLSDLNQAYGRLERAHSR